jgi:hypothetical protein
MLGKVKFPLRSMTSSKASNYGSGDMYIVAMSFLESMNSVTISEADLDFVRTTTEREGGGDDELQSLGPSRCVCVCVCVSGLRLRLSYCNA